MFKNLKEAATRADFPVLMQTGLKTSMMKHYNEAASEYELLVSMEGSTKDKETYPSLSMIGQPNKVLSGEAFPEKGIGSMQDVDITNYKFGQIIAITREMIDDDQTKKIAQQPQDLGRAHRYQENQTVFSAIVNGTTAATCYDGLAIFTTNHLNRKGGVAQANNDNIYTGITMSAGALIVALSMISLWKGLDDENITVMPKKIVCSDRLGFTAKWLTGNFGIPAYAANALGPASNQAQVAGTSPLASTGLGVDVCTWLTKISGASALDWYIWTDVPGWKFQVRDPLELYAEGNNSVAWFERDIMRWKSRKRYGFGNIDWRAAILIS